MAKFVWIDCRLTPNSPNRIVRDYEKYIARQLKRGTSRQELNVSWLKKNELELKRHVQDLRDNIRTNWSTTGQELGKELRQFWPSSRPQSPARVPGTNPLATAYASGASSSSTAVGNGANGGVDTPTSPSGSLLGPRSPGAEGRGVANDFMTGYTIGLIGGVRSWVSAIFFLFFSLIQWDTYSQITLTGFLTRLTVDYR